MNDHRPRLLALLSLFALALPVLRFGPTSDFAALSSDSAVYLMMADHYAASGDVVADYVNRVAQFPPLFPMLLAWTGGGSSRLALAHLLQGVSLLATCALFARLAQQLTGRLGAGLLLLACLAASPMTWLLHAGIWSEFTFMALAGGALLLAPRRGMGVAQAWGCAVLCALAVATRPAGLVLVAAFAIALLRHAPRRAWLALALPVATPVALFALRGGFGRSAYWQQFSQRNGGLAGLLHTAQANVTNLWNAWERQFSLAPGMPCAVACGALLLLAALGMAQRLRAFGMEALYLAGSLALLLVWPFPDVLDRLLAPLLPLLLIQAVLGAQQLLRATPASASAAPATVTRFASAATLAPLVLAVVCAAPSALALLQRYRAAPPAFIAWRASREWLQAPDLAAARADVNFRRAVIGLMRQSTALVPTGDCVHATQPGPVMFFVHRVSFPAPVGAARPARPTCHFQLLLGDSSIDAARSALWQPNETALSVREGGDVAGLLVRYPTGD